MNRSLRSALRTVGSITLWATLHSVLATRSSKKLWAKIVGEERRNATYRLLYNGVAVLTTGTLVIYLHRLPDQTLYRAKGLWRTPFDAARFALLLCVVAASVEIGVGPLSGISAFVQHLRGRKVLPEPQAQGPSLGPSGLHVGGPFQLTRHPLNFGASAILFLTPKMTVVRLALAITTLVYAVIGSKLEEHRLAADYGGTYEQYRRSGVPFFLPRLRRPT